MNTREFVTKVIEDSIGGYESGMSPAQLSDIIVNQFGNTFERILDRNFSDFTFDQLSNKIEREIVEA